MTNNQNTLFCSPTGSNALRESDIHGQGYFGAPRGPRLHRGVDFKVNAGSQVYSPVSGKVVRVTAPYKSDDRYRGLVIDGSGQFQGYSVKLFYLDPIKEIAGRTVKKGELIGYAQDLTVKYKGIRNHIHFEVTVKGVSIDPSRFLDKEQSCKV